jgi:hypothetical protein
MTRRGLLITTLLGILIAIVVVGILVANADSLRDLRDSTALVGALV